ncbi:MAG TPA: apolipoprotein N-acyltransferase, partial [Elusimicrobiota bacterium]|nr:apolipoprotein N-acyltransferase [Elusimicrobiota bacterium]
LVLLANALVLAAWETRGRPPRRVLAAGAAVLAAALAWSALRERRVRAAEAAAPRLRLALVQTNHDVETRRALARRGPRAVAEDCVSLSREALARGPVDAFVWPEGELRGGPDEPGNRPALDFARESGAAIWTGSNIFEPAGARNSALRLAADGASGRYDKTLLLPFGEFMPLAERFPILRRIKGVGRFSPGDGPRVFEDARARPAPLICYEAIRPGFVRAAFRRGADLLVNVTYDAWFGRTSCPYQHLMLAAVQSAQLGVPLARCATTGLSAVVDARGVIRARTALFTREILRADLPLVRLGSPYAALGPWFAWCCVAASAVLLARGLPRA